ncbi:MULTISPECIES: serine hydrolase [Prochlorococcus]|uniref:Beta-lactamase class A n=1 Tax=Prochlorococcus marinus (strain SARG / CCMP1375 / SS120) TaxID=167539 RepID=Q7VBF0_PROMA|nr:MULTISPECIES: serine hydrolase [Prochlorococcus]AAQ00190.1 Beta-lactamase class A [Prochlorococcus marinus subsp. marinus str. CCMP1375]KGG13989.1 Beta-lactamase [Prochlorococcus marinus str. LG]KGG23338.1 Beta-lactamase [Prochlorococcus marinus str. SS35]KGG32426.1 Beta-lactamase [Prochlorococcus marinus str. SS51]KGG35688.1 Beta-lactamase [Prochlorococcus sp. SS52]
MRTNQKHRKVYRSNDIIRQIINLALIGIGFGVLLGSLLKIIPNNKISTKTFAKQNNEKEITLDSEFSHEIHTRISTLESKWKEIDTKNNALKASGYVLLEDGRYAELNSNQIAPAASTIKIPILLICLKMVGSGELKWNEKVTLTKDDVAEGSGWIRYQPLGKEFFIHEIATEMIRVSDNTATNLLIRKIGGINTINQRFNMIGLKATKINSLLPDLQGTNTTTTKELVKILELALKKNFLSIEARDLFRDVLSTSVSNKLIPDGVLEGLGKENGNSDYKLLIEGLRVFNKTGDIGTAYGDAALIQMPNNTNVFASFIVQGPFNDQRSPELIRKLTASMIRVIKD